MRALILVSSTLMLSACAGAHKAVISGDGARQASDPNSFDTRLIAIDGRYLSSAQLGRAAIEPGRREVLVESLQPDARSLDERPATPRRETLVLNVQPCTEYYLKAVHPQHWSARFTVEVAAEKPLADCQQEAAAAVSAKPETQPSA